MPGIEARAPERTETSSGFDVALSLLREAGYGLATYSKISASISGAMVFPSS